MATVRSVMIRIGVAYRGVESGINRVNRSLESLNKHTDRIGKAARTGGLVVLAGSAVSLAAALGPAAGGLFALSASMAAALAPTAGLAVALPAVALALKAATGIAKLAVTGFGDAMAASVAGDMKAYKEGLKALTPAARSVGREVGRALKGLQQTTQQAFFRPIVAQAKGLGAQLRTPLQQGAAAAAAAMGRVAAKAVAVGRERASISLLSRFFTVLGKTIDNAGVGVPPLLRGLRAIVGVGLKFLPGMGTWVARIAAGFGRWLQHISASGRAAGWFTSAVGTLQQLAFIARNVGVTLAAMFRAATFGGGNFLITLGGVTAQLARWAQSASGQQQMIGFFTRGRIVLAQVWRIAVLLGTALANIFKSTGTQGQTLLTTIEQLAQKFAAWTGSAQGQQQMAKTFALLGQVAQHMLTILPSVVLVLAQVAAWINSLPPGVRGAVTQFLAWSIVLGLVTSKIMPLLMGFRLISKGLLKIGTDLADPTSKLGRFVRFAGSMIASLARGAASLAVSMARATATFLMSAARMTASAVATAARVVATWIMMAAGAMARAAIMAAAWLLAMGPIPLIIAAVIGLVALIILNWDKIAAFTVGAWKKISGAISTAVRFVINFVRSHWRIILTIIAGPLGLAVALVTKHWGSIKRFTAAAVNGVPAAVRFLGRIPGQVGGWFTSMKDRAVRAAQGLVSWIKGLPGRIKRGLGSLGSLLYYAGRDVLWGLWNGIKSLAGTIKDKIMGLVKRIIPGPVAKILGIGSPSKLFRGFGVNLGQGLVGGMQATHGMVARAAAGLANAAVPEMGTVGAVGMATPAGVAAAGGGGAAGGGVDYARLAGALAEALKRSGLTVQMDTKVVGEIVSQENGRVTSQRRRTG